MAVNPGNSLERKIFSLLKKGYHTVDEILDNFGPGEKPTPEQVRDILGGNLGKFITFVPEDKSFHIRHVLGPKPKKVPDTMGFRFEKLSGHPALLALVIPEEYTNPDIPNLAQLGQEDRGICVGCSGASATKLIRIKILKTKTPEVELKDIQRNVADKRGVIVDILPEDTVSAEAVYQGSRSLITPPVPAEGSYITDAAEYLVRYGVVPEWMWPTSKSAKAVYKTPPEESADLVAAELPKHKAEGWALIESKSGDPTLQVQQAILTYGACWMAMPVFSNYTDTQNYNGNFPEPSAQIVGYHAVCLVGWYNDTNGNRRWKFVNSWFGFTPLINTISDNYLLSQYKAGELQLITLLDSSAVAFLSDNYCAVKIESNLGGALTTKSSDPAGSPVTISIEKEVPVILPCTIGLDYTFTLTAVSGDQEVKQFSAKAPGVTEIDFTFIISYNLTITSPTKNVSVTITTQSTGLKQIYSLSVTKICQIYETYVIDAKTQYGDQTKSQTVYQTEAKDITVSFTFSFWGRFLKDLFAFLKSFFVKKTA